MSEPPSLRDLALQQCLRLAPYINDVGNASFDVVRPILARMSARQLTELETASPHLVEHTDSLWRELIVKDYPDRPCPTSNFRIGYQRIQKEKESHLGAARERLKRNQRQYAAQREASAIVPIIEPPKRRDLVTHSAVMGQYNSPIMQQLARKTHNRMATRPRPVTRQPMPVPTTPVLPRAAPFAPPPKKAKFSTRACSPPGQQSPPPSSAERPQERARKKPSPSIFIKRR